MAPTYTITNIREVIGARMRLAVRKRREVIERMRRENTMNMELGNTNRSKTIERRINVMRGEGYSYRKDTELGLKRGRTLN